MRKTDTIRKIGKHVVSFDDMPPLGDRLLTVEEVAELLNCSVSALNKWRLAGRGPRFIKVERRVRYRPTDIATYIAQSTRTSTSQQETIIA